MPPSRSLTRWLDTQPGRTFLGLSCLVVLLLYSRSLASPFLYDDLDQIVHNPNLSDWNGFVSRFLLNPVALTTHFLGYGGTTYRPIFWLSLYIDHALWGLNPAGFHATNLILHALNGNLAFALLRRNHVPATLAAATILLWLELPINTEAVAWISGRAYLLCASFILLGLIAAWNYLSKGTIIWGAACFASTLGAILSHELGVMVVPLIILSAWTSGFRWPGRLPATAAIACAATLGAEVLRRHMGVAVATHLASLKWAALALSHYVGLCLLPLHMSVERSTSINLDKPNPWLFVQLSAIALVCGYALAVYKKGPGLLAALGWFALCIAPFCSLMNYQGMAERFVYLASLGMAALLIALYSATRSTKWHRPIILCLSIWTAWNTYRTAGRVADWSDPVQLYRSSLDATPRSPSLHYNLAYSLREIGDLAAALPEYRRVVEIDRNYPHAYASLGDVYLKLNSYSAAQTAYKMALTQTPEDTAVLLNSGAAYQGAGNGIQAEAAYLRVLQIDPTSSAAHVNLGVLDVSEGRNDDAMHQFAMAIDLKTKDITAYYDLALILQQAGHPDLALVLYRKALELKPGDEDTMRAIRQLQQTP